MHFGWKFLLPASVINLIVTRRSSSTSMAETIAFYLFSGAGDHRVGAGHRTA
jgi:hypothetical protein